MNIKHGNNFHFLLLLLIFLPYTHLTAQTLDQSIKKAGRDLSDKLPNQSAVAIINFTSSSESFSSHVINELTANLVQIGSLKVVERAQLDLIREEQNFQMSGNVSDESMRSIGRMFGAQFIITGSLANVGTAYRFDIRCVNVESAQIEFMYVANIADDPQIEYLITGRHLKAKTSPKLWSIGVSLGTAFAEPWLMGTVRGTIAPLNNFFIELGFDGGTMSGNSNVDYYYLYPYANACFYLPLTWGGIYTGIGGGYLISKYTFPEGSREVDNFAAGVTAGLNLFSVLDISYTFRTDFNNVGHKVSVGYIYRFNQKSKEKIRGNVE